MADSIFTQIINREVEADVVYEQDNIIVIRDIAPKAKTHLLIIPKKEIATVNDLQEEDRELVADMFFVAKKIAAEFGIEDGYKLNFNVGKKGGQEVFHLHLHLLSDM